MKKFFQTGTMLWKWENNKMTIWEGIVKKEWVKSDCLPHFFNSNAEISEEKAKELFPAAFNE